MKKLLCASILAIGFCLMAGQAGAADLSIEVLSVDGNPYYGGSLDPNVSHVLDIRISLINWNYGTDVLFAFSLKFTRSPLGLASVNEQSIHYYNGFEPSMGDPCPWDTNYCIFSASAWNCAGNADPTPLVGFNLITTGNGASGTLTLTAETDAGVDYFIAHAAAGCMEPITDDRTGGDGVLGIVLEEPPCVMNVTPPSATIAALDSVQFSAVESGGCEAAQLVFSDTCAHGDVDNETGLFTTVLTRYETCEVSVFDTSNPDACSEMGSDCTASVAIMSDCAADCNSDGRVNTTDLGIMKTEFFRTNCATIPCQSDITGDGKVNTTDLGIMKLQFFRTNCPTP